MTGDSLLHRLRTLLTLSPWLLTIVPSFTAPAPSAGIRTCAAASRLRAADCRCELSEPCNVVLTHTNTDFDSLAGAVALARLWRNERPEHPTHVVMPRGVNPLVKKFLAYHKHLLPIRGFTTIRAEDVKAVGVVDTQSASRVSAVTNQPLQPHDLRATTHALCADALPCVRRPRGPASSRWALLPRGLPRRSTSPSMTTTRASWGTLTPTS